MTCCRSCQESEEARWSRSLLGGGENLRHGHHATRDTWHSLSLFPVKDSKDIKPDQRILRGTNECPALIHHGKITLSNTSCRCVSQGRWKTAAVSLPKLSTCRRRKKMIHNHTEWAPKDLVNLIHTPWKGTKSLPILAGQGVLYPYLPSLRY